HSPTLHPVADTLTFTAPYGGVWMSDHYANVAVIGDSSTAVTANPVHDQPEPGPSTQVVSVTTPEFLCGERCAATIAPVTVEGAKGLTIENNSDFYFELQVNGSGGIFV